MRLERYLLKRPKWRVYPNQKWFVDDQKADQYYSPLGKRIVNFTDETQFSRVAMSGARALRKSVQALAIPCNYSAIPLTALAIGTVTACVDRFSE